MNVTELMRDLPVAGRFPEGLEISGIQLDSRLVEPGDLFVALVGDNYDGRVFAADAIERGAVAVLGQGDPIGAVAAPWLTADQPRALLAVLSSRMWDAPDRRLTTVGVTGTNGKTTVAELVTAILGEAGRNPARIGTLGTKFAGDSIPGTHTTPEAPALFAQLDRVEKLGADSAVLEVSSHALALGRVGELTFDVAVFTNLSRDHFDFHSGWEDYFETKARLFVQLKPAGKAVICIDDTYGRRLAERVPNCMTYGNQGEVRPTEAHLDLTGIRATVATPRGAIEIDSQLVGGYNLTNLVAAVAIGEALDIPHQATATALSKAAPVPGRLERVQGAIPAFVDYAHTPSGLEAALTALRELGAKHLITVFGCGGDRDSGKRVPMGMAAGRLSDLAIATSDNPRNEDPMRILAAVEQGLVAAKADNYLVEPSRRAAIGRAIEAATPDSVVLVAGKGHEEVQILGAERIPFSDRDELAAALEELA